MMMIMAQTSKNMDAPETSASSDEIKDAKGRVETLEGGSKYWSRAVIFLLCATGALGIFMAIASIRSTWANDRLRAAEKVLADLQIEKLRADAARELKLETDRVRDEATQEEKRIENEGKKAVEEVKAKAETDAKRIEAESNRKIEETRTQADIKIAQARKETEDVRKQNLATEARLEEERNIRLELEKSLAPRVIPLKSDSKGVWNFSILKPYAGTQVILEYLPDGEAIRAASDLITVLQTAGWKVISADASPRLWAGTFDGIKIQASVGPRREGDKADEATDVLIDFLELENVKAYRVAPFDFPGPELPLNTIKITIGLRPMTHLLPKQLKEAQERVDKALKESREESKKAREESKKREEEWKRRNEEIKKYLEEQKKRQKPPEQEE